MRQLIPYILSLLAIIAAFVPSVTFAQDDISVVVSLNRDKIGMDESAMLTIEIEGAGRDIPPPDMPTLSMFDVRNQGQSSNFQIINGVMSSSVTYRYALYPKKAGAWPIKNISVVYNNKRYRGNDVTLTVMKEDTSVGNSTEERGRTSDGRLRLAFMEAEVDKKNPYVNEQVTLTLKFYVGSSRTSSPEINTPVTTGFWAERVGSSTTYQQQINNHVYKVYEVRFALFPTQTGELTIERVLGRITVFRDLLMFGGEDVSTRSNPVTVNVRPLPDAGRPDKFTGTIGSYKMQTQVDKTSVEVNQPITVTVRITGTGNIKAVAEPIIPESEDFRVYQASARENVTRNNYTLGGTKIFEEVFVPRRPGNLKLPALTFNFFNPQTNKYQSISSSEVPITVVGGEQMATSGELPYAPSGVKIGTQANDIRYLKQNMGGVSEPGELVIHQPIYLILNSLPVLGLIGTILFRRRQEKLATNVGYARARSATRQAQKRLARAKALAKDEDSEKFFAEISSAVISFVADKLNISPHGLTSDQVARLLKEHGAADEVARQTVALLRECDFARYTPTGRTAAGRADLMTRAEQLMVHIGGLKF